MNTPESQLNTLLRSLFTADELRRWVHDQSRDYSEISDLLPEQTGVVQVVNVAIDAMTRRGLIDAEFFQKLTMARPRRQDDIDRVATIWATTSRQPSPRETPSPKARTRIAMDPEAYFERWLSDRARFHHRWSLVGRADLCDSVMHKLKAPSPPWVLLEGRGGIGKTRLLIELWHRLREIGVRVVVYVEGSILDGERPYLDEFVERTVLLVDDAQRLDNAELEQLTKRLASGEFNVTLLMASRKLGVPAVTRACIEANAEHQCVTVPNLSKEERCLLAGHALGPAHKYLAEHLATTFPDSPLLITLGGIEIRQGRIGPEEVKKDTLLRDQVFARFPSAVAGDRQAIEEITAVASLLSRITPANLRKLGRVVSSDASGWQTSFEQLFELGIFADVNGVLRVLPDLYGSYAAMRWVVPNGVASGRLVELWQRLPDPQYRYSFLRNIPELMREVASPQERRALHADLRQIWAGQRSALRSCQDRNALHEATHTLVALAHELPSDALSVVHEFFRHTNASDDTDDFGYFIVQLISEAAQACTQDSHPLHAQVLECVCALLIAGPTPRQADSLEGLASMPLFTDALLEFPDLLINKESSETGLVIAAQLAKAAYRSLAQRLAKGEIQLSCLRKRREWLATSMLRAFTTIDGEDSALEIADALSEALIVDEPTSSLSPDLAKQRIGDLQSNYARLYTAAKNRSTILEFAVRRTVIKAAWRTAGSMGNALMSVLPAQEPDLNQLQLALLLEYLPESRHRERLSEEHLRIKERGGCYCGTGGVELLRRDSLIKFMLSAPDLRTPGLPFDAEDWSTSLERTILDTCLKSPVQMVWLGRAWVSILKDNQTEGLAAVLVHLRDEDRSPPQKCVYDFIQLRLDEHYARAVVRHSGPTQALCIASTYAAADLKTIAQLGRDAASELLIPGATPQGVWSALAKTAQSLQPVVALPRRYAVLYALVEVRPEWALPLAEQALTEGASVDTISAILQALWQSDRARARALAQSLLDRNPDAAHPVSVVLVRWMSTSDELKLACSLLARIDQVGDKTRSATFLAIGVLMARVPRTALDLLRTTPAEKWDVEPLLRGFQTNQFSADAYMLEYCEHIDPILASGARYFADHVVHPREILRFSPIPELFGFTPAPEHSLVRISRIHSGVDAPAWSIVPEELERSIYIAMAARRTFDSPSSQTFIIELARRDPVSTLRSVLASHTASTRNKSLSESLLETLLRPHLRTKNLAAVTDVLIDAVETSDHADCISKAFLSCMWILANELQARLEAHKPGEDKLLLALARIFERAELRTILASHQLVTLLFDKAASESPATRRSIAGILGSWSRKHIAEITFEDDLRTRELLAALDRILQEVGDQASATRLYRQIAQRLQEKLEQSEVEQKA